MGAVVVVVDDVLVVEELVVEVVVDVLVVVVASALFTLPASHIRPTAIRNDDDAQLRRANVGHELITASLPMNGITSLVVPRRSRVTTQMGSIVAPLLSLRVTGHLLCCECR